MNSLEFLLAAVTYVSGTPPCLVDNLAHLSQVSCAQTGRCARVSTPVQLARLGESSRCGGSGSSTGSSDAGSGSRQGGSVCADCREQADFSWLDFERGASSSLLCFLVNVLQGLCSRSPAALDIDMKMPFGTARLGPQCSKLLTYCFSGEPLGMGESAAVAAVSYGGVDVAVKLFYYENDALSARSGSGKPSAKHMQRCSHCKVSNHSRTRSKQRSSIESQACGS